MNNNYINNKNYTEELPLNANQNQTSLITNFINNLNTQATIFDSRYYFSTISLSKKIPLSKNQRIFPYTSIQNNNTNTNKLIKSSSAFSLYSRKINRGKSEIENYTKKQNESATTIFNNKKNKNIEESSVDAINVKMQMIQQYLRKQKEKMNQTKFKFYKIVRHNNKRECSHFKYYNERFNEQLEHFCKSDYFYKINKEYHKKFHFGNNYMNIGNNLEKHYIEPSNPEKIIKLNSEIVLNKLSDVDKKLIYSDPYFFFRDNKYLYELTKTKFKSLINRFKEEDKNEHDNENDSENGKLKKGKNHKLIKSKSLINKNIKLKTIPKFKQTEVIKKEMPFFDKKYINKIINEDLNKRLKNLKTKIHPVEKEMRKTITKLNTYKKKDFIFESNNNYYKSYSIRTKEDYFKPYSLEINRERLIKEKLFCKEINKKNDIDDKDRIIIKKYQKILEEHYNKEKTITKIKKINKM